MTRTVLGYKEKCLHGGICEYDGWSFSLFNGGALRFKIYDFYDKVLYSGTMRIEKPVVDQIVRTLQEQAETIESLPVRTNNGTCDGAYQTFTFLGKKITSLNIYETEEERIRRDMRYGIITGEEAKTMRDENTILKIFKSVAPLLSSYGLEVESRTGFDCTWSCMKERVEFENAKSKK